jgi:hypothetical protein
MSITKKIIQELIDMSLLPIKETLKQLKNEFDETARRVSNIEDIPLESLSPLEDGYLSLKDTIKGFEDRLITEAAKVTTLLANQESITTLESSVEKSSVTLKDLHQTVARESIKVESLEHHQNAQTIYLNNLDECNEIQNNKKRSNSVVLSVRDAKKWGSCSPTNYVKEALKEFVGVNDGNILASSIKNVYELVPKEHNGGPRSHVQMKVLLKDHKTSQFMATIKKNRKTLEENNLCVSSNLCLTTRIKKMLLGKQHCII